MTIHHALGAFRLYGMKGCVDHLKRILHHASDIARWDPYLIKGRQHHPALGISIIGTLSAPGSLNKVLRDFCINLKRSGVPFQAFDLGCPHPIPDSEYRSLLTPLQEFKLNRYSDIIGMETLPPLPRTQCRLSRIGFWEFESGLREAHAEFCDPGTLIANSKFNEQVFKKLLPTNVHIHHILYPFQFFTSSIAPRETIRAKYGIAEGDFMVFYNFDFNSGYHRKNPEGTVKAFAKAFSGHPNAKLVFKTMGAKQKPKYFNQLKNSIRLLGIEKQIAFINEFIPQSELVGLTSACDCYLSLHRGEGFGLGIAEAMILGKPTIITNYSAPTEFCNETNSIPIPYNMIEVQDSERDAWQYQHVKAWADPDLDFAARALRKLYDNRDYAIRLGAAAKTSIEEQFSISKFRTSVETFLNRQS